MHLRYVSVFIVLYVSMFCLFFISAFSSPFPCVLSSPWRSKASALSSSAARSTSWSESNTFLHPFCYTLYTYCCNCQWNVPNKCTKYVPIFVRFTSASHIWNWWFYCSKTWHPRIRAAILNPEALFRISSNSSYFRLRSFVFYLPFDSRRFLDERTRTAAPSSFLQKAAVRSCSRAPRYPLMNQKVMTLLLQCP